MLRSHINKLNKEKIQKGAARPASADEDVDTTANNGGESSSTSTLSALTFDTSGGNSDTAAATGTTMGATTSAEEDNTTGGRPKGSSGKSKRDVKQRQRLALLEATKQYQGALKKTRQENGATTRLMAGTLATIIENAKAFQTTSRTL
ncbi:hypothetical protein MHU86_1867 [Fragilaria crotonensis]|nr:hypothetical protein MHU86_1867 [Fragilaria crotonensis]